jgi:hypothetical protein
MASTELSRRVEKVVDYPPWPRGATISAASSARRCSMPTPSRICLVEVPVIAAPPMERKRVRRAPAKVVVPRRLRRTTAWIGVALLASVVSGFAAGGVDWSGDPRPLPAATSQAPQQEVAYTQRVARVVECLRERRIEARRRLRAARAPAGQAAASRALAEAYRRAREALPPSMARGPGLGRSLHDAERAYQKMVPAARGRDPGAWRVARREALRREAVLQRALRTGQLS